MKAFEKFYDYISFKLGGGKSFATSETKFY